MHVLVYYELTYVFCCISRFTYACVSDTLIETDLKRIDTIHDMLLNKDFPKENIVHEQAVDQLTKLLDDLAGE